MLASLGVSDQGFEIVGEIAAVEIIGVGNNIREIGKQDFKIKRSID